MIPKSTAQVTALIKRQFVRIDYAWHDRGAPQEGSLLIGLTKAIATIVWVDSWHYDTSMLISKGAVTPSGGVDVRGTYPVGDGSPDWGWRTVIEPASNGWTMTMFNLTPDSEESLAVSVAYTPSGTDRQVKGR